MAGLVRMSLDSPEETRPFEDGTGKLELVNLKGGAIGRATFEPGWKWSQHVKPTAKTDSSQTDHPHGGTDRARRVRRQESERATVICGADASVCSTTQ